MTNKIRRDIDAFRMRIKIGRPQVFAIVEGRYYDRPFYSRVLEESLADKLPSQVILAETISINQAAAGGKSHAFKIYDHFKDNQSLTQRNNAGESHLIVFTDRDLDDYEGTMRIEKHLIYTQNMDVEAEIYSNGNMPSTLCATHGLDQADVTRFISSIRNPISTLFHVWRDWIRLRLISRYCAPGSSPRFSQASEINNGRYGELDQAKLDTLKISLMSGLKADSHKSLEDMADHYLNNLLANNHETRMVPGKWIPSYLRHLMATNFSYEVVRTNISDTEITTAMFQSIDYTEPWILYYSTKITQLLAASTRGSDAADLIIASSN